MKRLSAYLFAVLTSCTFIKDAPYRNQGTAIDLSRRNLTEVPAYIRDMKELRVIRLYGNQLDSLPEWMGELTELERLYLGKNNLKKLPESIGNLKKLKILSAPYNELPELPESLGEMSMLEQLFLNQNYLHSLPLNLGKLQNLITLDLKFNELKALPEELMQCQNLQFLYLERNLLKEIPESLGNLTKLRELHLATAGPLLLLPESLCNVRSLDLLVIDQATQVPPCLLVRQSNRLEIVIR